MLCLADTAHWFVFVDGDGLRGWWKWRKRYHKFTNHFVCWRYFFTFYHGKSPFGEYAFFQSPSANLRNGLTKIHNLFLVCNLEGLWSQCFYSFWYSDSRQLFLFCWGMCLFEQWNKGTWFVWIMWRETNTVNNMCTDWCNRSSLMKWESYMKRSGRINSIQSMRPTHWEMRCFCQLLQGSRESTWPMGGSGFSDGCHVAMLQHVDFFGYSRRLSLHLRWWVDSLVAVLSDSNSILVSCTSLLCCASWCESSIDSKSGHASK